MCNNTSSKGNKSGLCRNHCHNKNEAIKKVYVNNSEIINSTIHDDQAKTKDCNANENITTEKYNDIHKRKDMER